MATSNELARLFKAIGSGDLDAAARVANSISDEEERRGHRGAAQLLRGSLRPNGAAMPHAARSNGGGGTAHGMVLADALTRVNRSVTLADVRLRAAARAEMNSLVAEWLHRDDLVAHGLRRRAQILFHGPPGCGKSLSACALGNDLSLPVYVVRFDAVVGAYLGQTALHLRELFRFAETTPCVLLIDEVDALGRKRGNPLDVGELDRIVVTLMQELEHAEPLGFVIATSNLPHHLDDALARRFDLVLPFPRPTRREITTFAKMTAERRRIPFSAALQGAVSQATSFSDTERLVEAAARRSLLRGLDESANGR